MKKISKINFGDLGKSFSIFFILIVTLRIITNFLFTKIIIVEWWIFGIEIILAAIVSYLYYRLKYHTTFSYDKEGFILEIGKEKISSKWKDFKFISLYYGGLGKISLRLYINDIYKDDYIEIPVSDLGLSPKEFRSEVSKLISN